MKFTVTGKHVSHMGRLGVVEEMNRTTDVLYETPTFMLYAKVRVW